MACSKRSKASTSRCQGPSTHLRPTRLCCRRKTRFLRRGPSATPLRGQTNQVFVRSLRCRDFARVHYCPHASVCILAKPFHQALGFCQVSRCLLIIYSRSRRSVVARQEGKPVILLCFVFTYRENAGALVIDHDLLARESRSDGAIDEKFG